ncbi:MAG: AzlC family ABC transporter permease [Bacillota bacterium]|nr:AzlC family ABC transporter permease [Bacillota bacterium]MDW7685369.1 AzlC family ABC transporter permease [Bacillota bacterium]
MVSQYLLAGSKKAIPIVLGYLPLGFAYGALASLAGISLPVIVMMSLIVFAGSAQFISVSMLAAGAGGASIIATVFLVNLRHLLMSASLSTYLQKFPRRSLPLLAFWLTDENYAVACGEFQESEKNHLYMLGLFGTAYAGWVAGGALGGIFGGFFTGAAAVYTMEYALYAMFIFLLVIQMTEHKLLLAAFVSGILSLVFYLYIPGTWYIMLATVCTATLGVMVEKWNGSF